MNQTTRHSQSTRLAALAFSFGLFVSLLLAPSRADALGADYTPTAVGCFDNGKCFVVLSSNVPNNHSSYADKSQVRFRIDTAGGDAMYKGAMAAFLSGQKLHINVYATACTDGYPTAWFIYVKN